MMAGLRAAGRGVVRAAGRLIGRTGGKIAAREAAGVETEVLASKRTGGSTRILKPATFPKRPVIGAERSAAAVGEKTPAKGSKLGAALTGATVGLMASDIVSGLTSSPQSGAVGNLGSYAPSPTEGIAKTAASASALHDKTILKIARLEARTQIRLAKIQRNRDMAMAYLSNPVVGIGLAFGTVVAVKTAFDLAGRMSNDARISNAVVQGRLEKDPVLTMSGLTSLQAPNIPPMLLNTQSTVNAMLSNPWGVGFSALTGMPTQTPFGVT